MKTTICLVLSLMVSAAHAASFDERVQAIRGIENTSDYKRYERSVFESVGGEMTSTMRQCFKTVKEPDDRNFTLVADISASGEAMAIDVQPKTNIADCFVDGFGKATLPTPPARGGQGTYPIYIDMVLSQ